MVEQMDTWINGPLTGVRVRHAGRDWPSASVAVLADNLTVVIAGESVLSRTLAASAPLAPP